MFKKAGFLRIFKNIFIFYSIVNDVFIFLNV